MNTLPGPRSVCQHLPGAGGVLFLERSKYSIEKVEAVKAVIAEEEKENTAASRRNIPTGPGQPKKADSTRAIADITRIMKMIKFGKAKWKKGNWEAFQKEIDFGWEVI